MTYNLINSDSPSSALAFSLAFESTHANIAANKHIIHTIMSSNTTIPFGGPPPFGLPPTNGSNNNNNAAPAAEKPKSPSSIDSETFAEIDVIITGITDDIVELLSSLQQFARKRSEDASVGLSVALDVKSHLQGQQDLDGCVTFLRTHGRNMEELARSVFAGNAARWEEDCDGESAGENEEASQGEDEEEYVASEEDTARVQWMEASEAMEVVQRLQTLQNDILRDIPLLSKEERAHRPAFGFGTWVHVDHWSEVLEARLKGERFS
jgi:hypothetical protein